MNQSEHHFKQQQAGEPHHNEPSKYSQTQSQTLSQTQSQTHNKTTAPQQIPQDPHINQHQQRQEHQYTAGFPEHVQINQPYIQQHYMPQAGNIQHYNQPESEQTHNTKPVSH